MRFIKGGSICFLACCFPVAGGAGSDWAGIEELGAKAYANENYSRAEAYFTQALDAAEGQNITDARLLAILNNLASTYTQLGKFQRADEVFERLNRFRTISDPPLELARNIIESDVNRAALTFRRGNPALARLQFEDALIAAGRAFSPEDPTIALICNHLALVYRDSGQYTRARELAERALAIREKAFGPESLRTAASLSVLSQVLQAEGDFSKAEQLCRQALAIRRVKSPGQSNVAESLSNLGTVLKSQRNYAAAEQMYKEAQRVWGEASGKDSFGAALVVNNLAALYQSEHKFRKSVAEFQHAEELMEHAAGPDSAFLALVLTNLAALYRELHQWDQAEPLLRRALKIEESKLGPMNPRVAADLDAVAQIALARRDYSAAEPLLLRALSINENASGKESGSTAKAAFHLATLYQLWAKPGQAVTFYTQALDIWKASAAADLGIAGALESYAALLKRNDQFADAEQTLTTAMGIRVTAAKSAAPGPFPRAAKTGLR